MTFYHAFVSHNGRDKPIVERLCHALLDAGLRPWFDKWDLAPGELWIPKIEQMLLQVPAILVCIGKHGWSAWHEAERQAAISRVTEAGSGVVIPVLLPGAPRDIELPAFLRGRQWTDLRREPMWEAEIARLAATLTHRELPGPWIEEDCERPYRGLEPFTEADAGWMFGREREEARLLDALRSGQRFVTVVGASGSGKSSLVRAGVVPTVRTGGIGDGQRWHALVMRPGARPCQALALKLLELQRTLKGTDIDIIGEADRLDELSARFQTSETYFMRITELLLNRKEICDHLLVVVDQFEELFTSGRRENAECHEGRDHEEGIETDNNQINFEGAGLLKNLFFATRCSEAVHAIITVRADFTGECLSVPALARQMERMHFALPPMEAEQLLEAIRRPALRVGYDVDEALIDKLVTLTEDQPGRLPLLQHTLDVLWKTRDRDRKLLSYTAYREHIGSLDESIARRADDVFSVLIQESSRYEAKIRQIFLRLVHLGDGTGDTRRRVPLVEFEGREARLVLGRFIEARLIVSDIYQYVEITHEALLSRWTRLGRWIGESREELRLRQELSSATSEWKRREQPESEVWAGGRLERALEAFGEGDIGLSVAEQAFLDASRAAAENSLQQKRRQQHLLFWGVVFVSLILSVALGAALVQYANAKDIALQRNSETKKARAAEKAASEEAQRARQNEISSRSRLAENMSRYRETRVEAVKTILSVAGDVAVDGAPNEFLRGLSSATMALRLHREIEVEPVIADADEGKIVFSQDGSLVYIGGIERALVVRLSDLEVIEHLDLPSGDCLDAKFVEESPVVACVSKEKHVIREGGSVPLRDFGEFPFAAESIYVRGYLSRGGEFLLVGDEAGSHFVNFGSGKILFSVEGAPLAIAPDGDVAITAIAESVQDDALSKDYRISVTFWRLGKGTAERLKSVQIMADDDYCGGSFSEDGKWAVATCGEGVGETIVTDMTKAANEKEDFVLGRIDHAGDHAWLSAEREEVMVVGSYAASISSTYGYEGVSFRGHSRVLVDGALSPIDNIAMTTAIDGSARLWRGREDDLQPVMLDSFEADSRGAAFLPDGTSMLAINHDRLRLYSVYPGVVDGQILSDVYTSSGVHYGKIEEAGDDQCVVKVGNLTEGTVARFDLAADDDAEVEAISLDGTTALISETDCYSSVGRTISAWNVPERRRLRTYALGKNCAPVVLSSHGRFIAFHAETEGQVEIWAIYEDRLVGTVDVVGGGWGSAFFSKDEEFVAVAKGKPFYTRLSSFGKESAPAMQPPPIGNCTRENAAEVEFSPGGEYLILRCGTTSRIWSAERMQEDGGDLWLAKFSPDGNYVFSVPSAGNRCEVKSLVDGRAFDIAGCEATAAAFSPDSGLLAFAPWCPGEMCGKIRMFRVEDGVELMPKIGLEQMVGRIAFSNDSESMLSVPRYYDNFGTADNGILLWRLQDDEPWMVIRDETNGIPNGNVNGVIPWVLLAGNMIYVRRGEIVLGYPADPHILLEQACRKMQALGETSGLHVCRG